MKSLVPRLLPQESRALVASLLASLLLIVPVTPISARARAARPDERWGASANGGGDPARAVSTAAPVDPMRPAPSSIAPAVTATKTDSFPDPDGDGKAAPGEEITYEVTVANSGDDAAAVEFTDSLDPHTSLVSGSVTMSPLARDDAYAATRDTQLVVPAASGLLANDGGIPAPTAAGVAGCADASPPFTCPTAQGGTVTLAADGSFTYDPAPGFQGKDTFAYAAANSNSPDGAATVTVAVDAAPAVSSATPADGSAGVANDSDITVTFGEAVNVTGAWFAISCATSGVHTAAVSGGGSTFTLDPNTDFTNGELCTVTVYAAQVTDQDSNDPPDQMAADYAFSFAVDSPPAVSAATPADGATGVRNNADISITFGEPVDVTGDWFRIACTASGTRTVSGAAVTGGPTAFTINPNADFSAAGETCTVTVFAAQVSDQDAGDPPDLMSADYVFSFTVDAGPTVAATTPAGGAAQVANNANVTVTFSEPVNVAGEWFSFNCAASGVLGVSAFTVAGGPTSFTLDKTTDFTNGELCTVTVNAAQVTDQDSNDPPDAMSVNHVFSFTVDNPPAVTSNTPAANATGVAANTNVTVTFSEPVQVSGDWFQVVCDTTTVGPAAASVTGGPTVYTINPSADLPEGVTCTTTVFKTRVSDADAGDPPDQMPSDYVFSFKVPPRAVADSRAATGNVRIVTTGRSNFSVLGNDVYPTSDPVTVSAFDSTSARGGQVSVVAATGAFVYNPPAGYEGSDSFSYTITNGAGSSTSAVTITVAGMVWFVDDNPASGACTTNNNTCGRLTNPFSSLAAFEAANGNASPTNGGDVTAPEAGDHLFIYSGNYTAPLALENNQRVVGQGAASALQTLSGVTPAPDSDSLPATGGAAPSITSPGNGFDLRQNNQIYGLSFSNTVGAAVNSIANVGTLVIGDVVISNASSSGGGVILDDGGASVTSTGTNSINTRSGVALSLTNATNIGASNLTFRSVSAGNNTADADPAAGIVLNNTGAAGGLVVTGTGSAGSGGTIQRATVGVSLVNTAGVRLNYMAINSNTTDGINGSGVTGFTLADSSLVNNGSGPVDEGVEFDNLWGVAALTNVTVSGSAHNHVFVDNTSGTLNSLTISGGSYSNNSASNGNNGIEVDSRVTATISAVTISGVSVSGSKATGIFLTAADTATFNNAVIQSSSFTNNNIAIDVNKSQASNMTFKIQNNPTITGQKSHAINVFTAAGAGTGGSMQGRIVNNVVGNGAVGNSGSAIGHCIRMVHQGASTTGAYVVDNNQLYQCPKGSGLSLMARSGTGGAHATVTNNTVNHINTASEPFPLSAVYLQSNDGGGGANTLRLDVRGNNVPSTTAYDIDDGNILVIASNGASTQVLDNAPASANVLAEVTSHNTGTAAVYTFNGGAVTLTNSPPVQPSMAMRTTNAPPGLLPAHAADARPRVSGESSHGTLTGSFPAGKDSDVEGSDADQIVQAGGRQIEKTRAGAQAKNGSPTHLPGPVRGGHAHGLRRDRFAGYGRHSTAVLRRPIQLDPGPRDFAPSRKARFVGASYEVGNARALPLNVAGIAAGAPQRVLTAGVGPKAAAAIAAHRGAVASAPQVAVSIGTLPANKSVKIRFKVTVNNPFGGPSQQVSNQGTVSHTGGTVLTDDPATGGASDPTVTAVAGDVNIRANDAAVAEATFTTPLVFTVTLSSPAGAAGLTVDYATADGGGFPATGGAACGGAVDYEMTSGSLTFASGEKFKTVAVGVCADTASGEGDETLRLNLSNAAGGVTVDSQATGTITQGTNPGALLISELRTSGPGGAGDDFVELYNNTDSPLTVQASDASAGYGLFATGADCSATPALVATIPNGTVIPARGHFLAVGSQYSLSDLGGTGAAAGDLTMSVDVGSDHNVALFSTSDVARASTASRLDAVGFGTNAGSVCDLLREGTNLGAAGGSAAEHSFFRAMTTASAGNPRDTNDNAADFTFADTAGTPIAGLRQRLGAPGPENLASPIRRDTSGIGLLLLDGTKPSSAVPNRIRDFTVGDPSHSTFGTLAVRRRVTNNTGVAVTRLRFRVIEMTTFPGPGGGVADLRVRSSSDTTADNVSDVTTCAAAGLTAPCTVTVRGTTLEGASNQPHGGGLNTGLVVQAVTSGPAAGGPAEGVTVVRRVAPRGGGTKGARPGAPVLSGTVALGSPLSSGESVNVQFLLGIQQTGTFRFLLIIEALP